MKRLARVGLLLDQTVQHPAEFCCRFYERLHALNMYSNLCVISTASPAPEENREPANRTAARPNRQSGLVRAIWSETAIRRLRMLLETIIAAFRKTLGSHVP